MSEIDNAVREVLHREFSVDLEASGDGRTVDVRIVPFNVPQRVVDPPPRGTGVPYEEVWIPGAFDKQTDAAHRIDVLANFEHEQGIGGIVGKGTELRDTGDALEGTFRMLNGPDGDKMLELVESGYVKGVSLEAQAKKSVREDGLVKRVKAHLINVAFCRQPAFKQAEVLAVRTEQEIVVPELNSELAERLERIGFEPLLRRAIVRKPWDGSASRFEDDEWKRSCLLDRGASFDTAKTRYALPVLEPNGDLNVNALGTAAGRLNQVQGGSKPAAARKLARYYRQAGVDVPASVLSAAAR